MNRAELPRRPAERRSSGEHGMPADRRMGERRKGERRSGKAHPLQADRRSGLDRRSGEQRADEPRRSGRDRRVVPERLNRVSAILLPPVLHPRTWDGDTAQRDAADPRNPDTRASLEDALGSNT